MYTDQVELSRNDLLSSSHTAFKRTHAELIESLNKLHMHDTAFYNDIAEQRELLFSPLQIEQVETKFTLEGGTTMTKTFQIGQRVESYKAMLAKKEMEVRQCWVDWEKVQKKIIHLGIEVLGPEAFEEGSVHEKEKRGYSRRMELLDIEHETWLEEIEEEIKLIGQEAVEKITAAEKVSCRLPVHGLDDSMLTSWSQEMSANQKKEQATFFARLFADDD